MMEKDFVDLFREFNDGNVNYLVVGGIAVGMYSEVRATKDIDVWIGTQKDNLSAAYKALAKFGAPLAGVPFEEFAAPGSFYQMGQPPVRIDIMQEIEGVRFDDAWPRRMTMKPVDGLVVNYISREDLLTNKRALGRPRDLLDVEDIENCRKSTEG